MAVDRTSAMRLASIIAGLENHEERIHNAEFAWILKNSPVMLREYHALLGIAARLELLIADAEAPVRFPILDMADGALRPPFAMEHPDAGKLMKFMRTRLGNSPVTEIEITADREVRLWGFVYDEVTHCSRLEIVASSEGLQFRRAS